MGKIFYSVGGEGRGHATRVRSLVEALGSEHEIFIYAPAHAYELLEPVYRHTEVTVRRIPGIISHYGSMKQLHYMKTGWHGMRYMVGMPRLIKRIEHDMKTECPDLVLTDFEPSLPRAARRLDVPFLSINHQHFLLTYDLSMLPSHIYRHVKIMGKVVESYYQGQKETIVSSFYFPPLKSGVENVIQIGVLLRPEILHMQPEAGSHLVAYMRRFAPAAVLETLEKSGCEVRVYGLGSRPSSGNLRFYDIDILRFIEDLASCRALICTAGNQLVGEALFLGKPVLAMPEYKNFEQYINAHFLERSGGGEWIEMHDLNLRRLAGFLAREEDFKRVIDRERLNGNPAVLRILNRYLPHKKTHERPPLVRRLERIEAGI